MVKACLQFSPAIFLARKTVDEEIQIIAKHQHEVVLSHNVTLRTEYIPKRGAKFYQGFPIIPPHQDVMLGFKPAGWEGLLIGWPWTFWWNYGTILRMEHYFFSYFHHTFNKNNKSWSW